jgi:hypothetical protein
LRITDPKVYKKEAINTVGEGPWNELGVEALEALEEGPPLQRYHTI